MSLYLDEAICPVCGKDICMMDAKRWAYKRKSNRDNYFYFCSWKCLQSFATDKGEIGKRMGQNQRELVIQMLKEGKETKEIMDACKVTSGTVKYWRERI